jgi:hypothetical protein
VTFDDDPKAALLGKNSTRSSDYKREMSVRYIKDPRVEEDQWPEEKPAPPPPEAAHNGKQPETASKLRKASGNLQIDDDGYLPTNVVTSTTTGSNDPADDGYLEYCGGGTQSNNNAPVKPTKTTARKFTIDYEDMTKANIRVRHVVQKHADEYFLKRIAISKCYA